MALAGGQGTDHAGEFAEEQLEDGGMRRFVLAVMGKGEDRHRGLCLSGTPATQGRKMLV